MCCGRVLAGMHIEGLSADDPTSHLELPPTPTAARSARAFLTGHLSGIAPDDADAATVCVSELVTNGVLHARTPLLLGVTEGRDLLLVSVSDQGEGQPMQPPPDEERPSGRGLMLVAALSTAWGVQNDIDGKTVWFTVPRSDS